MVALIILGAIVVIAVAYFAAKEFKSIAEMKGHDPERYFWWCFFVGIVGMMMVVALPDRNNHALNDKSLLGRDLSSEQNQADELPDL